MMVVGSEWREEIILSHAAAKTMTSQEHEAAEEDKNEHVMCYGGWSNILSVCYIVSFCRLFEVWQTRLQ